MTLTISPLKFIVTVKNNSSIYQRSRYNSDTKSALATSKYKLLRTTIAVIPLQAYIGHLSAEHVAQYQPTKLAAMEAKWETSPAGQPPDWSLLAIPDEATQSNKWEITIPNGLGYVLEFKKNLTTPVLRSLSHPTTKTLK